MNRQARCGLILAMALMAFGSAARADQFALLADEELEKKVDAFVQVGMELRLYCAPCEDREWEKTIVREKEMKGGLMVNGQLVDLAYCYVKVGGKWKNLAMHLHLKPSDVPKFLPKDLPEKK